jgi:hypothetical protein
LVDFYAGGGRTHTYISLLFDAGAACTVPIDLNGLTNKSV